MLMLKVRRPSVRALESWAIGVLLEARAIKECEEHGYMQCRGDPDARAHAIAIARDHPLDGITADDAVAALHAVLSGMGDTCPEC